MYKFLIIKPSSFGDIIHGLQMVQGLKEALPGAQIHWVARDTFAPFVEVSTVVDRTFVFKRNRGVRSFLRLMHQIRKERYDYVLDLQGLFRSGLMTFFSRADHKFGRFDAREGSHFFYNSNAPEPPEGQVHALEILLQFAKLFGLPAKWSEPLQFYSVGSTPFDFPKTEGQRILMFPESRRPEKVWPHFEKLTQAVFERYPNAYVLWAGASKDKVSFSHERFFDFRGETRIEHLPQLIEQVDLVVANDSGPMHLAAAMHRPITAIFGPTKPERYGPYPLSEPRNQVVMADSEDLSLLTPDTVLASVEKQLSSFAKP